MIITADRNAVRAACENYLINRDLRILREREAMITERMKPRKSFFGFFKEELTREQAIEVLKSDDGFCSSWSLPALQGSTYAHRVKRILSGLNGHLATGNTVQLTDEEAYIINLDRQ